MTGIREILFPTDLSAASERAFEHARLLAERSGARLVVYHAIEIPAAEYARWGAEHDACHAALFKLIGRGHTGKTHGT